MVLKQRPARWAGALVLAAGLAACDGNGPVPPPGDTETPSRDEVGQLAEFIAEAALAGWGAGLSQSESQALGAPPVDVAYAFEASFTCVPDGSGSVTGTLSGTIDRDAQTGTLETEAVIVLDVCQFTHDDVTFTIDTDPEIQQSGEASFDAGRSFGSFTLTGAFTFTADDGRAGSCELLLTVTFTSDESGTERTVTGTVCDQPVDRSGAATGSVA